jgi:hypothetical protein
MADLSIAVNINPKSFRLSAAAMIFRGWIMLSYFLLFLNWWNAKERHKHHVSPIPTGAKYSFIVDN